MFQRVADRLQEREQCARPLRKLEAIEPLVCEPRHLAADHVAHVQLRELVAAQVEHGIAAPARALRATSRASPRRAASDTPTKIRATSPVA